MMLDPTYPITFMLTIGAFLASGYAFLKGYYQFAFALLLSIVTARYLTVTGVLNHHNLFMLLCGLICIIKFDGKTGWLLDAESHAVNYAVSILYMIRIVVVEIAPSLTGLIVANDISLFLLFIQIILVTGAAKGGHKFNKRVYYYGGAFYDRFILFRRS